jgi:hypothetical protein
MKRRQRRKPAPFPVLLAELAVSSWETIAWRSWLILQGSCSPEEYQRMIEEKVEAAHRSGLALAFPGMNGTIEDVLAPWHQSATANAKRLRKA